MLAWIPRLAGTMLDSDLGHPQTMLLVPALDRLLGIEIEREVVLANRRLHPARLVAQHQMGANRRDGQRRVDDRRKGMHQIRPCRVEQPQGAAALGAEVALSRADLAIAAIVLAYLRAVDADGLAPFHLEAGVGAHQVDGEASSSGRLAADAAVAELVGVRRVGIDGEADGLAPA
jgi:hypothetical protein